MFMPKRIYNSFADYLLAVKAFYKARESCRSAAALVRDAEKQGVLVHGVVPGGGSRRPLVDADHTKFLELLSERQQQLKQCYGAISDPDIREDVKQFSEYTRCSALANEVADFCKYWSKELGSVYSKAMLNKALNKSDKVEKKLAQFTKEKDDLEKAIDARVQELQAKHPIYGIYRYLKDLLMDFADIVCKLLTQSPRYRATDKTLKEQIETQARQARTVKVIIKEGSFAAFDDTKTTKSYAILFDIKRDYLDTIQYVGAVKKQVNEVSKTDSRFHPPHKGPNHGNR